MKSTLYVGLLLLMTFTSGLSFIGYLGNVHWIFDLFVHFKLQYLVILSLGIIGLILLKKNKLYVIFLLPIFTNACDVGSLYIGRNRDGSTLDTMKICSVNVLSSNHKSHRLASFIQRESPDILIIQELTPLWQLSLQKIIANYPYRREIPRNDNFGIALYSKRPFESLRTLTIGTAGFPSILGEISTNNGALTIIATHPPPPIGGEFTAARNSQLSEIARITAIGSENYAVFGDLNTSSYSTHFKALLNDGKLFDSRKGYGVQTTWPTWFPLASTALDHCLTTENVVIKSRKVGENVGSDHLPIVVELGIKKE